MPKSRLKLAAVISWLVVLTLLAAFAITSLILWAFGDWQQDAWGLELALKIMWGVWTLVFVGTLLTHAAVYGWHFRRPRPSQWPRALKRSMESGDVPAAWVKSGVASFTITVVLVSLLGTAVLASVLILVLDYVLGSVLP